MKRCMYCGQENEDSASSCVKCGNPLLDMPAEDVNTLEEVDLSEDADMNLAHTGVEENAVSEAAEAGEAAVDAAQQVPVQEIDFDADEQNNFNTQNYGSEAQAGEAQYGGQAYGYPESEQPVYEDNNSYEEEMDEEVPQGSPQIQRKSRKMVKSFLFFLAALVFTISVGAEIANWVSGAAVVNLSTVTATIKSLIGDNMVISLMNSTVIPTVLKYQQQNALIIPAIGVVLAIPQILIALGLWMAFGNTSAKRQYVNTSGYTLIRVIEILKCIVTCLGLLAVIGLTVSFVVAAAAAGSNGSMMTLIIGIISLLVVVILAVFIIMYYVQLIFSVRAIRTNVRNGESVGRIPGFVIFIGFLCTCATIASMLPMAPDDYIGLAARGSKALWLLLITLWALVYRLVVRVKQN